jgi:hypothetical protein
MGIYQVPAVVIALLTWLNAPSPTIGQASKHEAIRRSLVQASAHVLTDTLAPAPLLPPDSTPPLPAETAEVAPGAHPAQPADPNAAPDAAGQPANHDQQWWSDRIGKARTALAHDHVLAEAMQTQINSLTNDWANRDDPAQKAKLGQQREQALAELGRLNKQIADDQKAIADIQEEARRQGVPPGWIR